MEELHKIEKYQYNPEFYLKFRNFVKKFMHFFYKINVTGLENIDSEKNYLYAGNHLNILDSWLLLAVLDSNLRFMVDPKLYRYKSWEHFFKSLGTFSLDQSKEIDINSLKTVTTLLKENYDVVIFPEGQTHSKKEHVDFKPGVPRLASMGKSSLMPFGINGSYIPFKTLNINFGEEIELKKDEKNNWDNNLESTVRQLENGPYKKLTTK